MTLPGSGKTTPAQHHCRRPNAGAPSTHVAGLNVIAGDPSNQLRVSAADPHQAALPFAGATHTVGDPTPAQHHCWTV
jgi:hypothetical protein